jgi:ribosomal subunit interface protein
MKFVIKTTNLKLDREFSQYIEEKLNSLEKFSEIFQTKKYFNGFYKKGKSKVEAWVEIGKTSKHHQKGKVFWVECQLRFPGRSIRSIAQSEDLRVAINEVKDELQRELKYFKNKLSSKIKRR